MLQNALPAIGLLVLMMLAAWLLQRYRRHLPGRLGLATVPMQVTGGLALGPQHRLVSVRIGEGADAVHVVLGVAPGGIAPVTTLPSGGPLPEPVASKEPGFAEQLAALSSPKDPS